MIFVFPVPAAAQVTTGSISGTAVDPSGAAIAGAAVTITNRGTGAVTNDITSDTGGFRFPLVPVGTYDVAITKSGFRKLVVGNVQVDATVERGLGELQLQVGEQTATVEVTAGTPLIETAQAQVTSTISGEALNQYAGIAENEGLDFLALTLPGVANSRDNNFSNTNGVGFVVNGIRGRNNDQQIDGQNNNDNSVAGPGIFIGDEDFVKEYDIITNNFGPEYGRNSGSVVNEVTKSGTNSWHGTVFGTETNSVLTTLTNIDTFAGVTKAPRFNQEFTGGSIGGPISKDRVFFFGGFDDQILGSSGLFTSGLQTPTPSGIAALEACFPGSASLAFLQQFGPFGIGGGSPSTFGAITPTTTTTNGVTCTYDLSGVQRTLPNGFHGYDWISRLDFLPTKSDAVFLRFYLQKQIFFNSGSGATGYPENVPSIAPSFLVNWAHTFNNHIVNEFRASYSRADVEFGGNTIGNTVPVATSVGTALTNIAFTSGSLQGFGPATNLPQSRLLNTYQLQDNFHYTIGRHQLKAGGNFTLQRSPNVFLPNFNGAYLFTDWGQFAANTPSDVSLTLGNPSYGFQEYDSFLYVGDDWKVKENLTLNLGLTWSYYGQPANLFNKETVAQQASSAPFWGNFGPSVVDDPKLSSVKDLFGPSVGFAYSPRKFGWLGDGKTVIRGGYRLTYDPAYYNTFLLVAISAPAVLAQTFGAPNGPVPSQLALTADPVGTTIRSNGKPFFPFGTLDPRNFNRTVLPPNFGPDRVHEWSLGIQRELNNQAAVEVRYVGNHGYNLFQSVNANPFIAGLAAGFPNLVPAGITPCTTPLATVMNAAGRVNCDEGVTNQTGNTGFSNYDGLQAEFRTNALFHQLTLRSSYTYSHTLDNSSEIFSTAAAGNTIAYSQNVLNFRGQEYATSGIDFPQTWTLTFVESIPFMRSQQGVVGHVLGGWSFSGTYILQSGQPYSPAQIFLNSASGGVANDTAFDVANIGTDETSRPFVANPKAPAGNVGIFAGDACAVFGAGCGLAANTLVSLNTLNQTCSTGCVVNMVTNSQVRFIVNGGEADTVFGTPFGNAARNSLRDRWTNVGNFSLYKDIKFKEHATLQWHMSMLNVFNHPQYGSTFPGVNPFIENAGVAAPFTEFANSQESSSAYFACPAGVRCILFGLKVLF